MISTKVLQRMMNHDRPSYWQTIMCLFWTTLKRYATNAHLFTSKVRRLFLILSEQNQFIERMTKTVKPSSSWNPGAKFLLLFNNPDLRYDDVNGTNTASKIFELMYHEFNVPRVVILYATGIKTYNVFNTNPYRDENDCREGCYFKENPPFIHHY